jgi:hypothetical protein
VSSSAGVELSRFGSRARELIECGTHPGLPLLLFLTIWVYGRYAEAPPWPRYLAVFGAYALTLMSKPMVVTGGLPGLTVRPTGS